MICLRALGSVDLDGLDGRSLRAILAQPKRLALLAYLANTRGMFHRRDTLLAVFWPELNTRRARDALNQAVRFLRKELGDSSVLVSRGDDELGVDEQRFWFDVAAFRDAIEAGRQVEALDLYRGDFLEGFFVGGETEFQNWLEPERARLREMAALAARALDETRTTTVAPPRDIAGTELNGWQIVRQLGRGGMATVYLAKDVKHDRHVALKVMHSELAPSIGADRFLREIQIMAGLAHPHILPLIDSGAAAGTLYLVAPFVEGESLKERISRERCLLIDDALRITREIAGALDYAHRKGVVHRDIKPANVLLQDDQALVADFGIARALRAAESERLTTTGLSPGTPAYMSPEQAAGEREIDGRSDVYSLATVLYEMLTGNPPHIGAGAQSVLAKVLTEPVAPVRSIRGDVPEHVEAALVKALSKNADNRFESAEAFANALTAAPTPHASASRSAWWRRAYHRRVAYMVAIPSALAVVTLTATKWLSGDSSTSMPEVPKVAVLPLDNLTRDPQQDYFVEGMYNALIGELAELSALQVIPRSSVSRYAGTPSSVADITREFKVDAIVKGGVTRSGDSVGINVQLIGTRPLRQLWSGSYRKKLRDIFSLHDDVARAITTEIAVKLTPREKQRISDARPVDPGAYDAWLAGSYHASRRSGVNLEACFHFAKRSAAADPTYAPAYELLAECYNMATFVNSSSPGEMFEGAKRAARHALTLDENRAPAHAALAYATAHYDWDWQRAEQIYRRALQLNPSVERAEEDLAWLLSWQGRFDEALSHAFRAKEREPFSVQTSLRVAMILIFARRYDEAVAEARHAILLDSTFMFAYSRLNHAYSGKGDYAQALAAAERAVSIAGPGDVRRKAFLAHAYAMNGQRAKARTLLDQLLALQAETYVPPTAIAIVYVGLGDKDKALTWLERGYDGRDGDMVALKVFPIWDPLRDHPRYQALLRKMKFPT